MTRTIDVRTASPYTVTVGEGLLESVAASVPSGAARVLIVCSAPLRARVEELRVLLDARGLTVVIAEVPDAEAGKTAEVLSFCWQVLGKSDFTRSDVVIGLGGGAVTDLAGFVAATWLRGVSVIQVPTTLLAMVDAAVGGKTGINTAEGKNLVGAFHEPLSVWCDVLTLDTLPRLDLAAGLAEVVKCGFIRDLSILDLVEANVELLRVQEDGALSPDARDVLVELITKAVAVKADVVSQDLKESHLREILNYGHTFGHAIEYTERYQWRHGSAVSVGMVFAAELAHLAGRLSEEEVARHRSVLSSLGLPVTYAGGRWDALSTAMRRDKKTRGDLLRFVVLAGIGNPVRLEGPDPALVLGAYDAVSA
ncbi:3-dehydroquinate synthase [Demequina pelophila]|uniref:3-dehydroquinate synthase n=1 Tax=Demequina pelophila TaxID=1638984 RepID=UPI0007828F08|nr:3-dehydroquinate synthase [Demequina pelophila]